jgi:hypothetical protein
MQDTTRPAPDDYARAFLLGIVDLADCPLPVDPTVVSQVGCVGSSDHSAALGTHRALRPLSSELDLGLAGLNGHFAIVVG